MSFTHYDVQLPLPSASRWNKLCPLLKHLSFSVTVSSRASGLFTLAHYTKPSAFLAAVWYVRHSPLRLCLVDFQALFPIMTRRRRHHKGR